MTYEVGVAAQFEAAHQLGGDFGPAARLHGHTYRLEVSLRCAELQPDGTAYDLGRLRQAVDAVAASLDYRNLADVPGLHGRNTTAEVVARHCWENIAAHLREAPSGTLAVRLWESPQAWAGCEGPLSG
ncbi:MAG TPA: 6-carboxytetrahydropterin synthase [Chloroflexota bacterium]|nr:6-carboxytetrahydropterin synthase [Chloroflexota bacterium]